MTHGFNFIEFRQQLFINSRHNSQPMEYIGILNKKSFQFIWFTLICHQNIIKPFFLYFFPKYLNIIDKIYIYIKRYRIIYLCIEKIKMDLNVENYGIAPRGYSNFLALILFAQLKIIVKIEGFC